MEKLKQLIRDKNEALTILGVLHGTTAYTGPEVLHIDLTNKCNFNCIACWCRSPLLGDKAMPQWERRLTIPFAKVKELLDDVRELGGLRQVKLVGGGEPFLHPDILKIVEYIKKIDERIEVDINTNFSLVSKAKAKKLIDLGLDMFTVSLWAGSPEAYTAVHPNQTAKTFHGIYEVLKYIRDEKKRRGKEKPRIVLHDVVFKPNGGDVMNMLSLGLDVGAQAIQFVPMDPMKGKTESLLLSEEEKAGLLPMLHEIRKQYEPRTFQYRADDGRTIVLSDFDAFIRRMEQQDTASGTYDINVVDILPCYVGWLFARVMATGNVVPCCKGHRMHMGNIFDNRFKDIWLSETYERFRDNGLRMSKYDPYFSKMGNDASAKTGCYNCDNLWQNIPMQRKIETIQKEQIELTAGCGELARLFFDKEKR